MKFNKFAALLLCALLLAGASVGCSSEKKSDGSESTSHSDAAASESTSEVKKVNSKILVVWYSATGNTKTAAKTIADALGADTFEIVPQQAYTQDDLNWSDPESRVSKEHDNPESRNVKLKSVKADNWESYDTVFIGYPIWWGIAAWPVDTFIKSNSFKGKTVIPFCTSASSGLGESAELLAELAGSGNWKGGKRFSSGESDEYVAKWAKSEMN